MTTDSLICPLCGGMRSSTTRGLCPRCLARGGIAGPGSTGLGSGPDWSALPPPEVLGEMFGDIEISAFIGKGGMGAVYRGRQTALGRDVAVKLLPVDAGTTPEFAERFRVEAQALARISHPNIVGVHDFGEREDFVYITMELVEGADLASVIAEGVPEPHEALRLVGQIARALQYVHDRGVVHRDIKPANILIDGEGNARIVDFGLAKVPGSGDERLTTIGDRLGTPHYMAPEQHSGERTVDHRADIYALGVLCYELLTGDLPSGSYPPPSRHPRAGQALDGRIDRLVHKAMELDPDRRFQRADQVADRIDALRRPQPRHWRSRAFIVAGFVATVGGMLILPPRSKHEDVPSTVERIKADVPVSVAGLPFTESFDGGKLGMNRGRGWRLTEDGQELAELEGGGIAWMRGASAGGSAMILGNDPFARPSTGGLRFEWDVSDIDVARDEDDGYVLEFGGVAEDTLTDGDSRPDVAVRLRSRSQKPGLAMDLYRSAVPAGRYTYSESIQLPDWDAVNGGHHTVWIRIAKARIDAGWSGGDETVSLNWSKGEEIQPGWGTGGEIVRPFASATRGARDPSGTHILHRFKALVESDPAAHQPFRVVVADEASRVTPANCAVGDEAGAALVLRSDFLLLGSPQKPFGSARAGPGYVAVMAKTPEGNWNEVHRLTAPDGKSGDRFGQSITGKGELLLIGAPGAASPSGDSPNAGSAYLFSAPLGRAPATWKLLRKFEPEFEEAGLRIGKSIALHDRWAALGAPGETGFVDVFEQDGDEGDWTKRASFFPEVIRARTNFGTALAFAPGRAAVGALELDDPEFKGVGSATVFEAGLNGGDHWERVVRLLPSPCRADMRAGLGLCFDGDSRLLVGVIGDRRDFGTDEQQGSVHLYRRREVGGGSPEWTLTGKIRPPDDPEFGTFGMQVLVDGERLFVSSDTGATRSGARRGAVYAFSRDDAIASGWRPVRQFIPAEATSPEWSGFGSTLDVNGDDLAVGIPFSDDRKGGAYILTFSP